MEAHRRALPLRLRFNRMASPTQAANPDQCHKPTLGLAVNKGSEEDLANF